MNHVVLTKEQQLELAKIKNAEVVSRAHSRYNSNVEKIELLKSELERMSIVRYPREISILGFPNILFSQENIEALFQNEIAQLTAENEKLGSFIYR